MKTAVGICLVAIAAGAATSAWPQSSAPVPQAAVAPSGGVPSAEILRIVRAAGLVPLTQPARRGANYVIIASDGMGGQLQVTLRAADGRILNATPANDPRFAGAAIRPPAVLPGAAGTSRITPPVAPTIAPSPRAPAARQAPPRETVARTNTPAPTPVAPARPPSQPKSPPQSPVAPGAAQSQPSAPAEAPTAAVAAPAPQPQSAVAANAAATPVPPAMPAPPVRAARTDTSPAATPLAPVVPLD